MKSVMNHTFSQVPSANIPRSTFDRTHGYKTTFNAGLLVPFLVDEALPGDTFNVDVTAFARLATPVAPIMDNMFMDTHFFAVPLRLVWDNWQRFCGEQSTPGASTDYVVPTMNSGATGGYAIGSVMDYMGIPTGVNNIEHSSLFFRAYNLIWNEWFRDQNIQEPITVDTDDGPDNINEYRFLQRRGKRHDYFTSCLPWPQKGDAVELPLGQQAFLKTDGLKASADELAIYDGAGVAVNMNLSTNSVLAVQNGIFNASSEHLYADLSTATAATINQLREAFQIQKLLERDARGGTRYVEIVKAHFGVVSPDARVQRPEYLGGGTSPVNITPIAQTSSTDATTPQGNLAAMGTTTLKGHGFTKSFTEHCIIIGLVSVRADLTYQQGLDRMFSRQTRYDFYWPALANLGEQAVLNKEIYAQGTSADDDVFGYQERYAEYRYKPSKITGQFRSTSGAPLDYWHLSQEFSVLPSLTSDFMLFRVSRIFCSTRLSA